MIQTVTQPANEWVSAYEPNLFEFKYFSNAGAFIVYALAVGDNWKINTGSAAITALFKVGSTVFVGGSYQDVIIDITGNVLTMAEKRTLLSPATFNATIEILHEGVEQVSIYVARLNIGVTWSKLADLYVIFRNGKHSVDVQGYLQDYFTNIQPPPVTGVDNELWVNYKLMINNMQLGNIHSSAYSTIEGLGASQYATAGKALRIGAIETFTGKNSIYSRINASTIENILV
jgi:hypothetical protein